MSFRFIHAADLHLDTPFKGLQHLPSPIREKITRSTFIAFEKLIDLALTEQVDFLLFAGDIYDSARRSLQAQLQFKQGLEKLSQAGIASFIVHGNHDPLDGAHIPIEWAELVYFFPGDRITRIPVYKQGKEVASIYGFSYPTARFTTNIAKEFKRESEAFAIGLLHTNVEGEVAHANYAPCTKQDLLQAGLDYWALGHVHGRQLLHNQPPIVYPGNLQGRHRLEAGEKGCYLVDVNPWGRAELSFVPLQDVLWLEKRIDVAHFQAFQDVLDAVEEVIAELRSKYGAAIILRITLVGHTELWTELSQEDVLEDLARSWRQQEAERERFIWIESIQFQGGMGFKREELQAGEGLYADLINLVDELLTSVDKLETLNTKALAPLLTHPRAQRFLSPFTIEERAQLLKQAEHLILAELLGGERR